MRKDHDLQRAVIDQLDFEPSINASHIGVAVRDGVATLSGHVSSFAERARAESVAGMVRGIKAVVDQIKVELPGHCETPDEIVARRAYDRLASNTLVPMDRVHVSVEDGVVTLRGDVDWQFQREAAVHDLKLLNCVRDIHNEIVIRPPVRAEAVEARIHEAMERLGFPGASGIAVVTEGTDVKLTGSVGSWHEKGLAESIAWSVPGVSRVDNLLVVP
jgi:osmotically-inducible protein OsmY